MASLPGSVAVGPVTYTVVEDADRIVEFGCDTGQHVYGFCDTVRCQIVISPIIAESRKPVTLWHEVKHAVWNLSALDGRDRLDEEEIIKSTAVLELQVLRNNPDLLGYLLTAADEGEDGWD